MTSKAEKLWEKFSTQGIGENAMCQFQFLAALREYGAAVRARDAEIPAIMCNDREAIHYRSAVAISHKISREPPP